MWDCSICIRGNTMEGMYHSNDFYNNKKNRYQPYTLKCCSCIYVPMFVLDTKKNKMAAHFRKVYNIVKKGH